MKDAIRTPQGYTLRAIAPEDLATIDEVVALQTRVFGTEHSRDAFLTTTAPQGASVPSLYLGAFERGKLIGFNVFISHDFIVNGNVVTGHQSGASATDPDHRGRGVFTTIQENAKRILRAHGAGFIFGFPNHNSAPIFAHKLGFRTHALRRAYLPTRAALGMPLLDSDQLARPFDDRSVYQQNDRELVRAKRALHGDKICLVESHHNFLWGRYGQIQRGPVRVPVLDVGGVIVNNPHRLPDLFFHKGVRAELLRFVFHHAHPLQRVFRHVHAAPHTEPFILFDLNESTTEFTPFTVTTGIKDAF